MADSNRLDCGCMKRGGTAEIYTCPEVGFGHGYSTEPFICDGDYHPPLDAIKVTVEEVTGTNHDH